MTIEGKDRPAVQKRAWKRPFVLGRPARGRRGHEITPPPRPSRERERRALLDPREGQNGARKPTQWSHHSYAAGVTYDDLFSAFL